MKLKVFVRLHLIQAMHKTICQIQHSTSLLLLCMDSFNIDHTQSVSSLHVPDARNIHYSNHYPNTQTSYSNKTHPTTIIPFLIRNSLVNDSWNTPSSAPQGISWMIGTGKYRRPFSVRGIISPVLLATVMVAFAFQTAMINARSVANPIILQLIAPKELSGNLVIQKRDLRLISVYGHL